MPHNIIFGHRLFKIALISIFLLVSLSIALYYFIYHSGHLDNRPHYSESHRMDSIQKSTLLSFLVNEEYSKLNNHIDTLIRISPLENKDDALRNVLAEFYRYDRGLDKFFDNWAKEYSNHAYPFMAKAAYHFHIGRIIRKTSLIRTRNPIRTFLLTSHYEQVLSNASIAIELMPKSLVPRLQALAGASVLGLKAQRDNIFTNAILIKPESDQLRWEYIHSLDPNRGGSRKKMLAFIEESKQYYKLNPRLKSLEAYLIIKEADKLSENKSYCEAIDLYRNALETNPNAFFYHKYGYALSCDRSYDVEALKAMQKSIHHWNHDYHTLHIIANLYLRFNNFELALKAINRSIMFNPTRAATYADRAKIQLRANNYDDGLRDAHYAIALNNKEIQHYEIGLLFKKSTRHSKIITDLIAENEKTTQTIDLLLQSKESGNTPFMHEEFDDDGNLKYRYQYVNGQKNGVAYQYYPSGAIYKKWTYINSQKSNPSFEYYEQGPIRLHLNYVNNNLNGISTEYYLSGNKKAEHKIVNGKDHGIREEFYQSGKLKDIWPWEKGKVQGKHVTYFPSGEIWLEENYDNGILEGKSTTYYIDGSIQFEVIFKNNQVSRAITEFSIDGEFVSRWQYDRNEVLLPYSLGFRHNLYNAQNSVLYKNSLASFLTYMATAGDNYVHFPKNLNTLYIHSTFKYLKPGVTYNWKFELIDEYGKTALTYNDNFTPTSPFGNMWYWLEVGESRIDTNKFKVIIYLDNEKLEELDLFL